MNHYDCIVAGFGTAGPSPPSPRDVWEPPSSFWNPAPPPAATHTVGGVGCYYFQQPVPGSLMRSWTLRAVI